MVLRNNEKIDTYINASNDVYTPFLQYFNNILFIPYM